MPTIVDVIVWYRNGERDHENNDISIGEVTFLLVLPYWRMPFSFLYSHAPIRRGT